MEIRRATLEEAELLVTLNDPVQKMHAEEHPHFFKYPVDQAGMAKLFRDELASEQNAFYIAWEDDQPLGYIWCMVQSRPENLIVHAFKRVTVDQISVNPDCRGKGVGKALMLAAEEFARECDTTNLGLSTWAFNTGAHGFFEEMGYSKYKQDMWKTLDL